MRAPRPQGNGTGPLLRARLAPAAVPEPREALSLRAADEVVQAPREPEAAGAHAAAEVPAQSAQPAAEPASASDTDAAPAPTLPIEGPPAAEIPQFEDPEYYPARLLDALPAPLAEVDLVYPETTGDQEPSGTVTLLLLIDELGIVNDATVLEADPPGFFEEAALAAFRGALFRPGQRDGRPVKSRLVVEVSFQAKAESMKSR